MDIKIEVNGIIVEKGDPFYEEWFGKPDPYYYAADTFLEQVSNLKSGDNLTIEVNTDGGSIDGAVRMYTKCQELILGGVNIFSTNVGKQHSSGTILMLCGQKGKRKAYNASTGMIHPPYIPSDQLWWSIGFNAQELEKMAADLRLEENRILDIYAVQTGTDKEILRGLMQDGKNLSASQLKQYGFIDKIIDGEVKTQEPAAQNRKPFAYVNLVKSNKNKKSQEMELSELNKMISGIQNSLNSMAKQFVNVLKLKPVNMDVATQEGGTLHVVRESGDIAVGDTADVDGNADGTATLEDGTVVTVAGGVIESIVKPDANNENSKEIENLKSENADLKSQVENLTSQLNEKTTAITNLQNDFKVVNETVETLRKATTDFVPQSRNSNPDGGKKNQTQGGVNFDLLREKYLNEKK